MTWVMGQPTILGHAVFLSDIQVTFTDKKTGQKTYEDCLEKMFSMDHNLVAGFAGNVIGGFALLSTVSKALKANKKEEEVFDPEQLIKELSPIVKRDYQRLLPFAKESGVHLLIGGVSHTIDLGIPGMGKPTVAILKSPNFTPEYAKIGEWISIGSGASVEKYKELIKKATGDPFHPFMKQPNYYPQFISAYISKEVQKMKSVKGISQHFHIAWISRDGVKGGTSDHKEYPIDGTEIRVEMPNVAKSLDEFLELMKDKSRSDSIAVATKR